MTEQQSQTPPPLKVILASKSPRRRDLLKDSGIKFTVRTPIEPVDEALDADELMMPVEAVKKLAERKAGALIQELIAENPQGLFMVLGADTMVVKAARSLESRAIWMMLNACSASFPAYLMMS